MQRSHIAYKLQVLSFLITVTVAGIFFSSCNFLDSVKKSMHYDDMTLLRDTLCKQYKTSDVNVGVTNGKYLTVSLINTSYNDSSEETRQRVAAEIGKEAYYLMAKKDSLVRGSVSFVKSKSMLIFHSTSSSAYNMNLQKIAAADTISLSQAK